MDRFLTRVRNFLVGKYNSSSRLLDLLLTLAIILSVIAVMLDSVKEIMDAYGPILRAAEWFFTILFTLEYISRILSERKPLRYIFSFIGIIDLLSFIPTYLSIIFPPAHFLLDIRILRLLRIFRIFKLVRYQKEGSQIVKALYNSRQKIVVFLVGIIIITVVMGTIIYLIEGADNGFTSIPRSVYWAIVTLTTVGYGDIAPQTNIGQVLASIIMIMGYSIIAVPTGIVGAEVALSTRESLKSKSCESCGTKEQDTNSKYCKNCGKPI